MHLVSLPRVAIWLLLAACLAPLQPAGAQSFCASDGQPRPTRLMERFINADCDTCWQDPATPKADDANGTSGGYVVLDWIVPNDAGGKGDDAPLSAVASRDGLARLEQMAKNVPLKTMAITHAVTGFKGLKTSTLRVSHGLPLSGYLGTSIELKPQPTVAKNQRWTAWLALVETLPAGTEGSPVARNLVRNAFQTTWNSGQNPSVLEPNRFFDARSMSVAQGVNPDKLRVIGWVEDTKGQVLAAAQSRCVSPAATQSGRPSVTPAS